jgi:WD40 repeat protein
MNPPPKPPADDRGRQVRSPKERRRAWVVAAAILGVALSIPHGVRSLREAWQEDRTRAIGVWAVSPSELARVKATAPPGTPPSEPWPFRYDGEAVHLRYFRMHLWEERTEDDVYRLPAQWEGNVLYYRNENGVGWNRLGEFVDGHFVIQEDGVSWVMSKPGLLGWGEAERRLARNRPYWESSDQKERRLPLQLEIQWPGPPRSRVTRLTEPVEPDRTLKEDPAEVDRIRGYPESIDFLTFSPDSTRLVTAGWTSDPDQRRRPLGYVRVWNVDTGRPEGSLEGVSSRVRHVALSPDGLHLVAVGDEVAIWDIGTRREVLRLDDPPASLRGVAYSRDGRLIATVGDNQPPALWDAATGHRLKTLGAAGQEATAVEFLSNEQRLVAVGDDRIVIWDIESQKQINTIPLKRWGSGVAFQSDQGRVALATSDTAKVLNLSNGESVGRFSQFDGFARGHVQALSFSPDGTLLAASGEMGDIIVWEADTGQKLLTITGYRGRMAGVTFSPDGQWLATAGRVESIELWDVASLRERIRHHAKDKPIIQKVRADPKVYTGHAAWVWSVVVTPDGKRAASAGDDETIKLWDLATGAEEATLLGHIDAIHAIALSPDGVTLASASQDGEIKIWDLPSRKERASWSAGSTQATALAFTPEGTTLVTANSEGHLKFWNVSTGKLRSEITKGVGPVESILFTQEGTLITGGYGVEWNGGSNWGERPGEVAFWDVKTGNAIGRLACPRGVSGLAATADGRTLVAAGGFDNTVRVYDVPNRKERAVSRGHKDTIQSVAVTADGKLAALGDWKGVIKLWEVASGRQLQSVNAHSFWVTSLAFTPDGKRLISGSADGTVKVWDVP